MQVQSTCVEQMSIETSYEGTKTQTRSSTLAAKMPYKNNEIDLRECEMGQRRGHSSRPQPLSYPLLLLMLCICFCTAASHPSHHPKFLGKFGDDDVSDGNLAAFNYLCPLGTRDGSNLTVALTSHGLLPCMRFTSFAAALSSSCADAVGVPAAVQGQESWPRVGRLAHTGRWTRFQYFTILFFTWLLHSDSRISRSKKRKHKKQQKQCYGLKQPQLKKRRLVGVCKKVGGRRFRVLYRRYRHLGQLKRRLLLTRLRRARWVRIRHSHIQSQPNKHLNTCPRVIQWICGYLGIRVGEASHPGPGDKKRKTTGDEAWTDESDSSLAQVILQVLQTHRGQAETRSSAAGPPANKKGKGGPAPVPRGESRLARILLQTLQAAITHKWTDEMVAQRLVNKITRHAPAGSIEPEKKLSGDAASNLSKTKRLLGEKLFVKVQSLVPQHAGKVTGMLLEMPVKTIKGLLSNDTELQAKVKEAVATLSPPQQATWADKVRPKPITQVSSKAKGKGKQQGTGQEPVRGPRFAVKINPTEWLGAPSLTTLPKLEQALTQGNEPPGNLIINCRSTDRCSGLKASGQPLDCKTQKLTIATINNKPSSSASVSVWWKGPGKEFVRTCEQGPAPTQPDRYQLRPGSHQCCYYQYPQILRDPRWSRLDFLLRRFIANISLVCLKKMTLPLLLGVLRPLSGAKSHCSLEGGGKLPLTLTVGFL